MAVKIVGFSFLFIGEDFVGLGDLLKLFGGFLFVVRIFIGVPLDCKLSVGFFDFVLIGRFMNSEDFVVADFGRHWEYLKEV